MSGQRSAVSRQPDGDKDHSPLVGESARRSRAGGGSNRNSGRITRWAGIVLIMALLITACGGDDGTTATTTVPEATTTTEASAFPVTVRGVEIPDRPDRIVSLSATHTEVLYEIGAGPQIVGTDLFSDHPPQAQDTEKVDAFNLNVEAVAGLDPDLVVLSYDPGDAVTGLAALGIPAVLFEPPGPTALLEAYEEWHDLGVASGHEEEADALVARVNDEADEIFDSIPQTVRSFTYYVELDPTFFSVGPGTLLDSIFGRLGMTNIVPADAGPFPQLSSEFIVDADPDYIFLADTVCCDQSAETLAERPGWGELSAVSNGNVVELDDSIASRWSHRIILLIRRVADEVYGTG